MAFSAFLAAGGRLLELIAADGMEYAGSGVSNGRSRLQGCYQYTRQEQGFLLKFGGLHTVCRPRGRLNP